MGTKKLSAEETKRQLKLLSITVDYDQLCEAGVLERVGKNKYKILDMKRLPEHVRLRIRNISSDGVVEFEDTVKWAKKLLSKL